MGEATPDAASRGLLGDLAQFLEMIKFSHSLFALPFALASGVLAGGLTPDGSRPVWWVWLWIVVAAVAARTAAMSFNRIVDRRIDAENPRTASRHLPSGRLSVRFAVVATLVSAAVFFVAAGMLNRLAISLAPFVLLWLLGYSYAKRFTALAHVWLGLALGLAPIGAWIAVQGSFVDWKVPVLIAAGVTLWTAGFDIIYACQDQDFDSERGLHSVPAALGIAGALWVARLLHVLFIVVFAVLPQVAPELGWIFGLGLTLVAALLVYEHVIVRADDLSRVNLAFFTLNGIVSVLLAAAMITDQLW